MQPLNKVFLPDFLSLCSPDFNAKKVICKAVRVRISEKSSEEIGCVQLKGIWTNHVVEKNKKNPWWEHYTGKDDKAFLRRCDQNKRLSFSN